MTDKWISPIEAMRTPRGIMDRLTNIETAQNQNALGNTAAQSLSELAQDTWALNTSFPSICQGRLTPTSGSPIPINNTGSNTIYFTPYIGNLIGIYNGSSWDEITFAELSLPVQQSQNGNTHNGTAVIDGLTDTSQLVVGMWVSGTGIPVTAVIQSIDSATQITMTVNSTASATVSVTFKVPTSQDIDIFVVNIGGGVLALRMVFWNARQTSAITGVTNASPMVVTSSLAGGGFLSAGAVVNIRNVVGATGANGTWRAGTLSGATYPLLNFDGSNSSAGGVYSSGGSDQVASQIADLTTRGYTLALQDGVYVLPTDHTWRYVGTVHVNNSSQVADSLAQRLVWNYYNRVQRPMNVVVATAAWATHGAGAWFPDNNDISIRLEFVVGIIENTIYTQKYVAASLATNATVMSGVSLDFVAAPTYYEKANNANTSAIIVPLTAGNVSTDFYAIGKAGYNWLQGMENATTGVAWQGFPFHSLTALVWA